MKNLFSFKWFLHTFHPSLINTRKLFGLKWHLLGNITSSEDRLQTGPKFLNFNPKIKSLWSVWKSSDQLFNSLFEGNDMSLSINWTECHLILFQPLGNLLNAETCQNCIFSFTPRSKVEFSWLPEFINLGQCNFNFLLFLSRLTNLFNIFKKI